MYVIETKSLIKQLFCKHKYVVGELVDPAMPFMSFDGHETKSVCIKCGRIKKERRY